MLDPNPTTLTIPNAGTESNVLDLKSRASLRLLALLITGPASLPETVSVKVSADGGTTYGTLRSGAADVTVGAAQGIMITELVATNLKLVAGGAVAAQRDFKVVGASRSAARG